MNGPVDVPDHSHARFAVRGGTVGALVAFVLGLIAKFLLPEGMLDRAFDVFMYVWPWYMGFAFTGGDAPASSSLFIGSFLFSVFLNFVTYWVISGVIWCGLNWHRLFLIVAVVPVLYYWAWLATNSEFWQPFR